jgi:hypothetical protein
VLYASKESLGLLRPLASETLEAKMSTNSLVRLNRERVNDVFGVLPRSEFVLHLGEVMTKSCAHRRHICPPPLYGMLPDLMIKCSCFTCPHGEPALTCGIERVIKVRYNMQLQIEISYAIMFVIKN